MKRKLFWGVIAAVFAVLIFILYYFCNDTVYFFFSVENKEPLKTLIFRRKKVVAMSVAIGALLGIFGWILTTRVKAGWTIHFKNKDIRIKAFPVLALLVLAGFAVGVGMAFRSSTVYHQESAMIADIQEKIAQSGKIIHAGGAVTGPDGQIYTYTNSKEAFEQSARAGVKFIEMDFNMTSDGHLVCLHNWRRQFRDADGNQVSQAVSLEEFRKGSAMGYFTVMTAEDLLEKMREYPDIYLVADMKGPSDEAGYAMLADIFAEMQDRVIAQIYHIEQYSSLWDMGYRLIIYSLYKAHRREFSERTLDLFRRNVRLVGMTLGFKKVNDPELFNLIKGYKIPIYSNTVDDPVKAQNYYDAGVEALYTNMIDAW